MRSVVQFMPRLASKNIARARGNRRDLLLSAFFPKKGAKSGVSRRTARAAAQAKGIPLQVPQVGSMFSLYFNTEKVRNYDQAIASDGDLYRKVFRTALDKGVYLAPSPYETAFISTAHEGKDIDKACEVLDAAVRAL